MGRPVHRDTDEVAVAALSSGGPTFCVSVEGMVCEGCEEAVEAAVRALPGVAVATASRVRGVVEVTCDASVSREQIARAVEAAGYTMPDNVVPAAPEDFSPAPVVRTQVLPGLAWTAAGVAVFVAAQLLGVAGLLPSFPVARAGETTGLLALFAIGLLTSVHCVAMCGGLNLGQSLSGAEERPWRRSLLYNAGRLTSYTLVGGVLGLAGGALSVTLGVRAALGLAAGIVMVGMAFGMLFGWASLARLGSRLPKRCVSSRLRAALRGRGPFAVGLANGFMPCGPLQAMQLYAIASGGFLAGASSMFAFCLGTVPLVLAVGVAAGFLKRTARRLMLRAGACLLLVFGLFMLQSNLALLGVAPAGAPLSSSDGVVVAHFADDGAVQRVSTRLHPNGYESVRVTAGVPVEWTIVAEEGDVNGCNGQFVVPAFGLTVDLAVGETVVAFTPEEPGTYSFSCWMGMLTGTIEVVEG